MTRMRSGLLLMAVGLLSLAFVACDGGEANGDATPEPTQTSSPDNPVSPGDPTGTATPSPTPDEDFERVEEAAPIEEIEVLFLESFPVQHRLRVVSGLPSGCAAFERIDVERDGTTFNVSVVNTVPAPGEDVACTMIYGIVEHTVELGSDLETGTEYTVNVNDRTTTFVAQ